MSIVPDSPDFSFTPGEESLVSDQAAAHLTTPGGHGPNTHSNCENCATPLQGPYCHQCGQHDFDFTRSFWHVALEALESVFHFDEKFFQNILSLLFRPGRLSADFNAGKRASQVPPFRLYVFVSFIFFVFSFLHPDEKAEMHEQTKALPDKVAAAHQAVTNIAQNSANPATKERLSAAADKLRQLDPKAVTATQAPAPATETGNKLHISINPKYDTDFDRMLTEKAQHALENRHETLEAFFHAVPKMLLFCLPLFALYTRVLFRRGGLVYLQHLIVSLHFHTFIFLWSMTGRGWVFLTGLASPLAAGWLDKAVSLWMVVYPLIMLHTLFGESWRRTLGKGLALAIIYGLTLLCGFAAVLIAIVLMR